MSGDYSQESGYKTSLLTITLHQALMKMQLVSAFYRKKYFKDDIFLWETE